MPLSTLWNDWVKYPFSTTIWNHRPLAVQTYALAYTSTGTGNETGLANAKRDDIAAQAVSKPDCVTRQGLMAQAQQITRDEAVFIRRYWRSLFKLQKSHLKGADIHVSQQIDPK
jgi:peptide/nickel transport system substrate-binding protein